MQQAFIIRAFNTKKDSIGSEVDFERIHRELIAPAIEAAGIGGGTTGKIIDAGNIQQGMFSLIQMHRGPLWSPRPSHVHRRNLPGREKPAVACSAPTEQGVRAHKVLIDLKTPNATV